jgi:hypothetical protein
VVGVAEDPFRQVEILAHRKVAKGDEGVLLDALADSHVAFPLGHHTISPATAEAMQFSMLVSAAW